MGLLERIGRIFSAEANAAVDTMENASKISDQIIRELRENLQKAIEGEAEIKAIALQHRAEEKKASDKANEWEKKANDLLDMIDSNKIEAEKGNELAGKAAESSEEYKKQATQYSTMAKREEETLKVMDLKIKKIKEQIEESEERAEMLKSKAKTAEVSERMNKTLSSVDTDGLMSTLNRMEKKVDAQEFRAQAYAEVDDSTLSSKSEIDKVLETKSSGSALEALKAKRTPKA